MSRWLIMSMLGPLLLAGCDEGDARVDFGAGPEETDRFSVHSRDGAVKLALTDDHIYFALSDSVLSTAEAEMAREAEDREGVGSVVGGMVRRGVSKALRFRAAYPVSEVRDLRWEGGRLVIEFTDGRTGPADDFQINDEPAGEAFEREQVEAFRTELMRLKRQRGEI